MSRHLALALMLLAPLAAAQEPDAPCHLHGRFIDVDGAPVAGARVTVNGSEGWRDGTPRRGRTDGWEDPAIAVSDADGRFEFSFVPPREYRFEAHVEHTELGRIGWSWKSLPVGGEVDLGDILLEPRAVLVGQIVDADGDLLVEGWAVMVWQGHELQPPRIAQMSSARVDPETGSFLVDDLPVGELVVRGFNQNRVYLDEVHVVTHAGVVNEVELLRAGPDDARRLLLTIRTAPSLERGPAPGSVHAIDVDGTRIPLERVRGRGFDWQALDLEPGIYTVEIDDPRYERWRDEAVHTGVRRRVHLPGSAAVQLDVRGPDDGARIEAYGLSLRYEPKSQANRITFSSPHTLVTDGARAPKGGLFAGLVPGDLVLELRVAGCAPESVKVKALKAGETRVVNVTPGRGRALDGRVVDANGRAAKGVRVVLTRSDLAGTDSPESLPAGIKNLTGAPLFSGRHRDVAAVTNRAGHFRFGDLSDGRYSLRAVVGPLALADALVDVVGADVEGVVLSLPATGALEVAVTLPEGLPYGQARVIAMPTASSMTPPQAGGFDGVVLGADGSCRFEHVPAGQSRLRLELDRPIESGSIVMPFELGTALVRAGETVTHSVDLRPEFPGWGHVRVTVDGEVTGRLFVTLTGAESSDLGRSMFMNGERGPLVWVTGGSYGLRVVNAAGGWCFESAERFAIETARPFEIELDVELIHRTLRVLDATGAPLAGAELCWWGEGVASGQARPTTDENGELALALPPGKYWLARGDALMQHVVFEWMEGADAARVRLPARKR